MATASLHTSGSMLTNSFWPNKSDSACLLYQSSSSLWFTAEVPYAECNLSIPDHDGFFHKIDSCEADSDVVVAGIVILGGWTYPRSECIRRHTNLQRT